MYKTVLVPLDGSVRAENILPHVEELAQRFTAKVIFLNVAESPYSSAVSPIGSTVPKTEVFEEWTLEMKTYLYALCDEYREKGIEAESIIVYGPIVETIIDVADREGVDLIAMASHGRSGLSRVFYGSVAAGVLQRVDRPLLLIRSRAHE
jgi:nucleotide-binding universal stress UspA family protein